MKKGDQILEVGMKSARERLVKRPNAGEKYPRDFAKLYDWLEDQLYVLYEWIMLRKTKKIFEAAGDTIFIVSEIAHLAEEVMNETETKVSDN